jgi:Leucine-rich repeat (LRR) protein
MSFTLYFIRRQNTLNFYKKTKLRGFQYDLRLKKDALANPDTSTRRKVSLAKKIEILEKQIEILEADIERRENIAANPDEFVKEYLQTLPANRKRINLSDAFEKHSLTTVPDLSRFTELRQLDISMNRKLSSGFDRLPTTLKKLDCYKTDATEDASWILRLPNLDTLTLSRNDRIRLLPDLSGMTNLVYLDISSMRLLQLPNMPLNKIAKLLVPFEGLARYYSKNEYCNISQRFACRTKTHSSQIIRRINRINQFDRIREELLTTGAKIVMNPARVKRLLDQSELDLDSDWSDIFECQTRRVHTTIYAW